MEANPDFSGWATKANLKCSDGRTIMPDAFAHQDQTKVPLVWQHAHNEPTNVLGYATLENRPEGVYCRGYFNDGDWGQNAKKLVTHGDITTLSIYANRLVEKAKTVTHGMIREVSLVLAGANPGAVIDFVNVVHADGSIEELEEEAIISMMVPFDEHVQHAEKPAAPPAPEKAEETVAEADNKEKTVQDVFNTLNEEQKNVVYYMLGQALKGPKAAKEVSHSDQETVQEVFHSLTEEQQNVVAFMIGEALEHAEEDDVEDDVEEDDTDADEAEVEDTKDDSAAKADADNDAAAHADNKEGNTTMTNVFESDSKGATGPTAKTLSHSEMAAAFATITELAKKPGNTFKSAMEDYAGEHLAHGIEDLEVLFPDARAISSTPEFLSRRVEWVAKVMGDTRHVPFSRIKSLYANLTLPEARAKGYVKGSLKKEEFFKVSKRVTGPTTIYKKQKLDRDDILDITDFDVVAWLKGEMRLMLEEEIARAVLVGDGRSAEDEDKINEENIRPIATDSDFYVTYLNVNLGDASSSHEEIVDALVSQRRHYRGSGNPTLFTSETVLARLLMVKDTLGRRIYNTVADLNAILRVRDIVTVEILDEGTSDIVGIVVNLADYTIGADRGGDVAMFDDFDIDYNQQKYLIETRISGALTKPKSALVVRKTAAAAVLRTPTAPSWNAGTHALTVPVTTGVTYKNRDTGATLSNATPVVLAPDTEFTVQAVPASGNDYLDSTAADEFLFTYEDGLVANF